MIFGVGTGSASLSSYPGSDGNSWGNQGNNPTVFGYLAGTAYNWGSETSISAGGYDKLAIDIDAGKGWFGNSATGNGGWYASGNPATGANPTFTFTPGTTLFLMLGEQHSPQQCTLKNNTGENSGVIPTGFTMWN